MICPFCNHRIQTDVSTQNRIKRRELILVNIDRNMTTEQLYRVMRKKGYDRTRKTFLRDLTHLEKFGKISLSKVVSDRGGYHYEIRHGGYND